MLLLAEVGHAGITLHEAQNGRPNHVEVESLEDLLLKVAHLGVSDCVVNHVKDSAQVWRVDLLVLASNVQGRDTEALQISLAEMPPTLQSLVNDANCHEQRLREHLKLIVQLSEPVHEVLAVALRDFLLHRLVQEVLRIHVAELLFLHVDDDLGHEFDDRLRVANLEHIVQVEAGLVHLEPVPLALCHDSGDVHGFFLVLVFDFNFDVLSSLALLCRLDHDLSHRHDVVSRPAAQGITLLLFLVSSNGMDLTLRLLLRALMLAVLPLSARLAVQRLRLGLFVGLTHELARRAVTQHLRVNSRLRLQGVQGPWLLDSLRALPVLIVEQALDARGFNLLLKASVLVLIDILLLFTRHALLDLLLR